MLQLCVEELVLNMGFNRSTMSAHSTDGIALEYESGAAEPDPCMIRVQNVLLFRGFCCEMWPNAHKKMENIK